MACALFKPVALAATLMPVLALASDPLLDKGGSALTLAYVSDEFLLSPIRLPPIERAPPKLGAACECPRDEAAPPPMLIAAVEDANVSMLALSAGTPPGCGLFAGCGLDMLGTLVNGSSSGASF